jgi:hypothetical protein
MVPSKKRKITPFHINGGFTDIKDDNIYVFRIEEFSKVILHEILHHIPHVHKNNWTADQIYRLKKVFNVAADTELIPNEAVVELWATIMHILFLSFEYKIEYREILNTELQHSIELSEVILDKQSCLPNSLWSETSNAISYILFKTILLYHINDIKSWDPSYITDFLIKHHDTVQLSGDRKIVAKQSLRIMKTSDL